MNKDLTVGKPESVLCRFCLPLFGSIIFQQLYNIADSFVAGKFIGDNALAAVGNSYEITLIFIAFAFGCNIGCSVLAAQLFGAKRYKDLKTAVYTSLISSTVICAVLMAVGMIFCNGLLRLIKTPDAVLQIPNSFKEFVAAFNALLRPRCCLVKRTDKHFIGSKRICTELSHNIVRIYNISSRFRHFFVVCTEYHSVRCSLLIWFFCRHNAYII